MDDATPNWPGSDELVRTLCTVPTHSLVTRVERGELAHQLTRYERGV